MATKKTAKTATIKRPTVLTPPRRGGSYVDGIDEEHRVGGTRPADRHLKREEADRADTD